MFKITIEEIKQVPAFEKKYEEGQYVYTPIKGKTTDDNRTVYSQLFDNLSLPETVSFLNRQGPKE